MSGVLKITNLAVQVVAGLGVSKVINDIVVNNTNVVTQTDAVRVAAGSIVLGSMIVDAATDHVQDRFTALANWLNNKGAAENVPNTVA